MQSRHAYHALHDQTKNVAITLCNIMPFIFTFGIIIFQIRLKNWLVVKFMLFMHTGVWLSGDYARRYESYQKFAV